MDEVLTEFVIESHENLEKLDQQLVALEEDSGNVDLLSSIFRTIHTIKGTAGFLGLTKLEGVTHIGENLLSRLRDGAIQLDAEITSALLEMVDAVRAMLASLEADESEGDGDYTALIETLTRLHDQGGAPAASAEEALAQARQEPSAQDEAEEALDEEDLAWAAMEAKTAEGESQGSQEELDDEDRAWAAMEGSKEVEKPPNAKEAQATIPEAAAAARVPPDSPDPDSAPVSPNGERRRLIGQILIDLGYLRREELQLALQVQLQGDRHRIGEILVSRRCITAKQLEEGLRMQQAESGSSSPSGPQVEAAPAPSLTASPKAASLPKEAKSKPSPSTAAKAAPKVPMDSERVSAPNGSNSAPAASSTSPSSSDSAASVSESRVRVDVDLLDRLMNLVGELVLARNQILQTVGSYDNAAFNATAQRLNLITTELQEGVMKTRMQPIDRVWNKFPRVVRDLAKACGKKVRLEMEGNDTELDRTIIDAIKDPMTHLVRNAVDHGIEYPDARSEAGKAAEGCLRLKAFHEGGQVNIEISDDGGGIDPAKIRKKALERGVSTVERIERMNDREVIRLIFQPGFSTAETVTNVSGRGVGMDVVKSNIQRIGGTVDVQSELGQGTTLKIKIPLTLAIIPVLIVTSLEERFAIPQVNLLELVRLEDEDALSGIEYVHGAPVYRLRGKLLPLIHLNRELGLAQSSLQADKEDIEDNGGSVINIVVLRAGQRRFGLVVDAINDTQEIVVKPLGKLLEGLSIYAGATIMGDGRVALILDVLDIAMRAKLGVQEGDRSEDETAASLGGPESERQRLLVVGIGDRRFAIPLSTVTRLEEFAPSRLESAQDQDVVQYRGQLLPLIRYSDLLGIESRSEEDCVRVVVFSRHGHSIGLIVDRIVDTVEEAVDLQTLAEGCEGQPGIVGSAVIKEKVTDLLDMQALIEAARPSVFMTAAAQDGGFQGVRQ